MCSLRSKYTLSEDMQRELTNCFNSNESRQLIDTLNEYFSKGNASVFNFNSKQMRFFQRVVAWNRKQTEIE